MKCATSAFDFPLTNIILKDIALSGGEHVRYVRFAGPQVSIDDHVEQLWAGVMISTVKRSDGMMNDFVTARVL
jgi:hypothetical protein